MESEIGYTKEAENSDSDSDSEKVKTQDVGGKVRPRLCEDDSGGAAEMGFSFQEDGREKIRKV